MRGLLKIKTMVCCAIIKKIGQSNPNINFIFRPSRQDIKKVKKDFLELEIFLLFINIL